MLSFVTSLFRYVAQHRTPRELLLLDDRLLRDIGLSRHELTDPLGERRPIHTIWAELVA